jgi:ESCRT-II complex subunit VPS25
MSTNYAPSLTPSTAPALAHSFAPSTTYPTKSTSLNPSKPPFPFPREYYFPPFFTRQPTLTTHHAQLQKWSNLILSYCRHHRLFRLSLIDALESDLFWNKRIGKRLSREDVREIVEFMRREGTPRAEWIGKGDGGGEFWVWWRNVEEWAGLMYDWVGAALLWGRARRVREDIC